MALTEAEEDNYTTEQFHKLSFNDLDHLWTFFGIGVSQIMTVPGFENFEVTG